jgi:hypothetical protein
VFALVRMMAAITAWVSMTTVIMLAHAVLQLLAEP